MSGARRIELPVAVSLRAARAEDVPQLEWFGSYADQRALIADAFARQSRGEVLMVVADLNGFPVGQAWIDFAKRAEHGIAVLWAVRVLPPLRRLGLGSALIDFAEQAVVERDYAVSELGVEDWNHRARALYERLGYRACGREREELSYVTPEGRRIEATVELSLMRKLVAGSEKSA